MTRECESQIEFIWCKIVQICGASVSEQSVNVQKDPQTQICGWWGGELSELRSNTNRLEISVDVIGLPL